VNIHTEVRSRFLAVIQGKLDEHTDTIIQLLGVLRIIVDKKSSQFADATMMLHYEREEADLCKRILKQYGRIDTKEEGVVD